jgi:hypothetical protein
MLITTNLVKDQTDLHPYLVVVTVYVTPPTHHHPISAYSVSHRSLVKAAN